MSRANEFQNFQDWEPVVIKKRKPTGGNREQQVSDARKTGQEIETVKKI